jgi:hypothetical protein
MIPLTQTPEPLVKINSFFFFFLIFENENQLKNCRAETSTAYTSARTTVFKGSNLSAELGPCLGFIEKTNKPMFWE